MSTTLRQGISRAALVVLIIVVLLVGVAAGLSLKTGLSSSTPSSSTTSQNQVGAGIEANPVSIVVTQVITDNVEYNEPASSTIWILTVQITDTSPTQQNINPYSFVLTTESNTNYSAFNGNSVAIHNVLNSVTLNAGGDTSGQITFEVPNSQTISQLVYTISDPTTLKHIEIAASVPQSLGVVSHVLAGGPLNGGVMITGASSSHLTGYASMNNGSYFYTGETIPVTIHLQDACSGTTSYCSGSTVTVTSIVDDDGSSGFVNSGLSQNLPVTVGTSEVDVVLYLKAPTAAFNGQVTITITASSSTGN